MNLYYPKCSQALKQRNEEMKQATTAVKFQEPLKVCIYYSSIENNYVRV